MFLLFVGNGGGERTEGRGWGGKDGGTDATDDGDETSVGPADLLGRMQSTAPKSELLANHTTALGEVCCTKPRLVHHQVHQVHHGPSWWSKTDDCTNATKERGRRGGERIGERAEGCWACWRDGWEAREAGEWAFAVGVWMSG